MQPKWLIASYSMNFDLKSKESFLLPCLHLFKEPEDFLKFNKPCHLLSINNKFESILERN